MSGRWLVFSGIVERYLKGRNGKVELTEPLPEAEGSRVIVTWERPAAPVNLSERGISEAQAADLRNP